MSFENPQERSEQPRLSLLEDFDACVEAVASIEALWNRSMTESDRMNLRSMMRQALGDLEDQLKGKSDEEKEGAKSRISTGFHGLGGFNRYEVRGDGTMILSRSHSIEPCRKRAREMGVDVTDY